MTAWRRRRAPRTSEAVAPRLLAAAFAVGATLGGAACAGSSADGSSATPSARTHAGGVSDYLLRLDELTLPGFTVTQAAAAVDTATLSGGDAALAAALDSAGIRAASSARYFRTVPELRTAIGPLDVTTTVIQCSGATAAAAAFTALTNHLDAVGGAIPVSTGPLGDGGHADLSEVTEQGVTVAQVTLTWRTGDLVSTLTVRERDTGSPVQDALITAHPQVVREAA